MNVAPIETTVCREVFVKIRVVIYETTYTTRNLISSNLGRLWSNVPQQSHRDTMA